MDLPDLPPGELPPAAAVTDRRFRLPVEYYSAPASEVRRLFPRWVPITLGSVAAALLLLVFAAGAIVSRIGLGKPMGFFVSSIQDEIGTMYAKDVAAAQKQELDRELTRLRTNLREEKVPVARLDPVMKELREAIADQKVTSAEAGKLTRLVHSINTAPKTPPPARK